MAAKALPAQDVLLQLLSYDPETGKLFWKERGPEWFKDGKQTAKHNAAIWNACNAGKEACSKASTGYLETTVLWQKATAHRLVWKMNYGFDPEVIDHIDGDKTNNRIENLRNVSQVENGRNHKIRTNNTSGVMGVCWDTRRGRWYARIHLVYKNKFLGYFDTFEEAVAARKSAEQMHGFHKNHGRAA